MPIRHDQTSPVTPPPAADGPMLKVAELYFNYPDGQAALKGASLSLARGEKAALVGPNGSGKSTLMLNIIGILDGSGEITVAGIPRTEENLPLIRSQVGLVFQSPDDQLFSPTVFEDVAFGPLHMGLSEAETRDRVHTALEMVEMAEYAERLSYHLSMGEKKRIAIATVLSMEPELIILDEPSAGLDPKARRTLIELLHRLPQSLLVATHDLLLVKELLPRTIILDEGQVVADGETTKILKDTALLNQHGLELP
ncbi:MAG: ATP-binding cassette domain-containing protein [Chloroflexota bacterium]